MSSFRFNYRIMSAPGSFDDESGIFTITKNSTLYKSGKYLNDIYISGTTFRDKSGYALPSFDDKYPIGPYSFDDLNKLKSNAIGGNSITGVINSLSNLLYVNVEGNNTLSGSITGLTSLRHCNIGGNSDISYESVLNLTSLYSLSISPKTVLTPTNIDTILGDFYTNKDYGKEATFGILNLNGDVSNNKPSLNGTIIKSNLSEYKSPGPSGSTIDWFVATR